MRHRTLEGALQPLTGQLGAALIILPRSHPYRIGRDGVCELQLFDVRISRRHAQIEFLAGEWVLSDLNSANGVYVNGARLNGPVLLRPDDTVEIGGFGGVVFRFTLADPG